MSRDSKLKNAGAGIENPIAKPQAAAIWALAGGAAIFVLTLVAYSPALAAGCIWDDPEYVLNNLTLRTVDGLRQMWLVPTSLPQWYPLVHTTFWIEYHLVGNSPLLYHLDNVLLHALSCVLLWRILRQMKVPGAYIAACVFAVHPVMVESVAWVTERKNVLSLVFYLLALRVYLFQFVPSNVPGAKAKNRAYAMAMILFIAALFSKTVTASLPAAILLILWWQHGRVRLRDLLPLLPMFAIGIGMGALTGYLESTHVDANGQLAIELHFSFVERCLIAGRAIWFYLGKLVFPYKLTFIYPRWDDIRTGGAVRWIFPALVVLLAVVLFTIRRRVGRGPLVAWLLFCGTLVPALGFVNVYPMRYSFVADHFQYHASIAMITVIVAMSWRLSPRMRGAIWGVVIVVCAGLTWNQTRIYRDAQTLWSDTAGKNPGSWMVWMNLGNLLAAQEKYDEAIPYYQRALALGPDIDETRWNAGMAFARQKKIDQAEAEFRRAIEINPKFAGAYESLGELYLYDKNDEGAAAQFLLKSLELVPGFAKARFTYAVTLDHQANDAKEAAARSKDPKDAQAWLDAIGRAIDQYNAAIESNPAYAEAHYNIAICLMQVRQADLAISHLAEAVRLKPDWPEAWLNLGSDLFLAGRYREASGAFQRALILRPGVGDRREESTGGAGEDVNVSRNCFKTSMRPLLSSAQNL